MCASPPRIHLSNITARADTHGAFGPLTPCPLSPSILTLCGQPGVDDQFQTYGVDEPLVDMRVCQSPKLPTLPPV
ncbi:hypothetical protein GPECTOR_17g784 [Gonium pectorale]|uniref:Uncharacterized protein n=1 Tax=Gonium pectorale TaxID=33097 RepID=A0A150GJZ3_GONPE|nr:hypothetical protein GPECTOR_17g784 [Gonium pectorale]|eukprot:KXZ50148.1 hypothetical protein GPECTOR_17g784 [Gonium pectorale]